MAEACEVTVSTLEVLAELMADQHAQVLLLRRHIERQNMAAEESAKREALLREERDQFAAENKCLGTRIARLERDLKLANRMVGKRWTRKGGK